MGFQDDVARFADKVQRQVDATWRRSVELVEESIVEGSALSGSPGQPEASGELKESWQTVVGADEAHIFTTHPGAPTIEAGTRRGRALVHPGGGGPHALALTRAAWPQLVEQAARDAGVTP